MKYRLCYSRTESLNRFFYNYLLIFVGRGCTLVESMPLDRKTSQQVTPCIKTLDRKEPEVRLSKIDNYRANNIHSELSADNLLVRLNLISAPARIIIGLSSR